MLDAQRTMHAPFISAGCLALASATCRTMQHQVQRCS